MKARSSRPAVALLIVALLAGVAASEQIVRDRLPEPGERLRAIHGVDAGARPVGPREGWPVYLNTPGAGFPYTPTLFDMDGDGADEIFLTGGHTFGLSGDGAFLPGWPTVEHAYMGYGTNGSKPGPSVGRMAPGGDPVVLWSERDWWAGNVTMWCFNGKRFDGGNLPGFPQQAPDTPSNALDTPFVLGDGNGDGILEAWGVHSLGNAFLHYRVSAYDNEGNRLFTHDLNPTENVLALYYGDLDGDMDEEFFAVSWLSPSYRLHVFDGVGGHAPGYPITLHTLAGGYLMFGPPIPADLDGDGDLEILIGYVSGSSSYAHCLNRDGSPVPGYPIHIASGSQLFFLGLGDLTGDGEPELLAFENQLSGNYRAYAIDRASGLALPGWPVAVATWPKSFPAVVDIDNDGVQDMCFTTEGGTLEAYAGDGTPIAGYPKAMASASISGVGVGDIDADGLFELVTATWDGWVYAWDTDGLALPGRSDWPMRGVDARNTGVYRGSGDLTAAADFPATGGRTLRLASNPVRALAEFLIDSPGEGTRITIHDTLGRRVAALQGGGARAEWAIPAELPAGVYLARLAGARRTANLKFVVLR